MCENSLHLCVCVSVCFCVSLVRARLPACVCVHACSHVRVCNSGAPLCLRRCALMCLHVCTHATVCMGMCYPANLVCHCVCMGFLCVCAFKCLHACARESDHTLGANPSLMRVIRSADNARVNGMINTQTAACFPPISYCVERLISVTMRLGG